MIVFLLILSVLVGLVFGYYFGGNQKNAKGFLVLSAGFLLGICVNEVFPDIYNHHDKNIGVWVLLGVLLQLVLENMTKGFEHGHLHHHTEQKIIPLSLLVGLFIHAFLEGIPLSQNSIISRSYLQGILIHNLPISFILGSFLFYKKKWRSSAFVIVFVFAISSPLGYWFGDYLTPSSRHILLALVSGIFLHISSVIIFESNKNHKMDWQKLLLVVLGMSVAYLLHWLH